MAACTRPSSVAIPKRFLKVNRQGSLDESVDEKLPRTFAPAAKTEAKLPRTDPQEIPGPKATAQKLPRTALPIPICPWLCELSPARRLAWNRCGSRAAEFISIHSQSSIYVLPLPAMRTLEVHKALADESRLRLLYALDHGAFTVQELTALLGVSQSTVSHHLKVLQGAGVVRAQREGTFAFYTLEHSDAGVEAITRATLAELQREPSDRIREDTRKLDELLALRRERGRQFFEKIAPQWQQLSNEAMGGDYLATLVEHLPDGGVVLELGCGTGRLLREAATLGCEAIGVDYSPAMLAEARKELIGHADRVDLRLGYLEHLPVADRSVDVAAAHMVFHHLPAPRAALNDAFRALRSGGRLLVIDLVQHDQELMRERFADLWLGFDPQEFSHWVRDAGFEQPRLQLLGSERQAFLVEAVKP